MARQSSSVGHRDVPKGITARPSVYKKACSSKCVQVFTLPTHTYYSSSWGSVFISWRVMFKILLIREKILSRTVEKYQTRWCKYVQTVYSTFRVPQPTSSWQPSFRFLKNQRRMWVYCIVIHSCDSFSFTSILQLLLASGGPTSQHLGDDQSKRQTARSHTSLDLY